MFRNSTEHAVEVMEGIEGVFRYLGSIPPHKRFPVRSVKEFCTYVVVDDGVDDTEWTVIPSTRLLSSKTVELVVYRDNDGVLDVQEESSESGEAQAPVNRTHERFQHFIEEFFKSLLVKSPNEYSKMVSNLRMDPILAEKIHVFEIGCMCWVRGIGQAKPFGSRSSELRLEVGAPRAALELWESREKVFKLQIDSSEAELKDCSNQIFQWLIAFYTVVHGVLFTVVSQPDSPFTCEKIHISYILSAIISFFTIAGVVQKLKPTEYLNEIIYEHKIRLLAVCSWQSSLKRAGPWFDYGTAVLNYKPRSVTTWWLPKFLPPEAVKYIFVIVVCSAVLCYIMQLLKCN